MTPQADAPLSNRNFVPSRWLRHTHLQSVLSSKSSRRRQWLQRGNQMERCSRYLELDAGHGVRLAAWWSPQPDATPARSLVVLIHGWEGSHLSAFLYSMACALHADGHAVLRLNLRDHGDSFHLNEDIFHSARIGETIAAISSAQALAPGLPLHIVGFSLGGSFALRCAILGPAAGLHPRLSIGISPLMHPESALAAIDDGPMIYRLAFMERWRRSLRAKAAAWPERWVFETLPSGSIAAATRSFAERHLDFGPVRNYYDAYRLTPSMLMNAPTPVAVITAEDDPIIPFADFSGLRQTAAVVAYDHPACGGHCGFLHNWRMESWAETRVRELLDGDWG